MGMTARSRTRHAESWNRRRGAVPFATTTRVRWWAREPLTDAVGLAARDEFDISAAEVAACTEVTNEFRDEFRAHLAGLYRELGREPAETPSADIMGALERTRDAVRDRDVGVRIAAEVAGHVPPVGEDGLARASVYERYVRLLVGLGAEYERRIAGVIGKERARELRMGGQGWGRRGTIGGCRDDE